ncbi:alpha/beta hydrolase [Actinospica sp. MGRD01-02]|uniref:Alpha/beta hydrolase n=1 Tax=Actinospica acidithermotolerans TaxID=2828514 RepID=A0A941EF05_9ACTN|nr:alpha/beta hydrolase [Actinospica acidithermotolerans]MBR7829493.1 alpha/beta hydrolase [Actinospica acidithermotolerans]
MGEQIEFVTADDGCRLWSVRSGTEAPGRHGFVLCHGGPGFWDTLGPIARMVEDHGPVVRWDQRGGGRSEWQEPYTVARFLADLDQVREHHGFNTVTVLGHSWGATVALRYALADEYRPRVRGLVYVAGIGYGRGTWMPEFAAAKKAASAPYAAEMAELEALESRTPEQDRRLWQLSLAGEFPNRASALELAATQVNEVFAENETVHASLRHVADADDVAELEERIRGLEVPTLIVDGMADLRPRHAVDPLAAALPRVTRVRIAGAGHFPWLDAPEVFEDALSGWLIDPVWWSPSSP